METTVNHFVGSHIQTLIPVSLITASLIMFLMRGRAHRLRAPFMLMLLALLAAVSIKLLISVNATPDGALMYMPGHAWSGDRLLPTGEPIGILVRTDMLGAIMVCLTLCLGLLIAVFAVGYLKHGVEKGKHGYFWGLYSLCLAGLCGISLTGDFFNTFVFIEVASISSYALVAMGRDRTALEAAFKYTLVGAVGSAFYLVGVALIYYGTGTLNMMYAAEQIQRLFGPETAPAWTRFRPAVQAALGFFMCAFLLKMAIMPGHAWLADAHPAAPAPVSALLSGVFVKVTGAFVLIRIVFDVYRVQDGFAAQWVAPVMLTLAAATIILGSVFAIAQTRLKRMLAFSTISQMGYILMGMGLMSFGGLLAAVVHIVNHAVMKTLLFLCSGDVIRQTGNDEIECMRGMGLRRPVTYVTFTVGAVAMVGIPFFDGFVSKLILGRAVIEAGQPMLFLTIIASTFLSAIYYLRASGVALLFPPGDRASAPGSGKSDRFRSGDAVVVFLALLAVLTGVWPHWIIIAAQRAVEVIF